MILFKSVKFVIKARVFEINLLVNVKNKKSIIYCIQRVWYHIIHIFDNLEEKYGIVLEWEVYQSISLNILSST